MNADLIRLLSDLGSCEVPVRGQMVRVRRLTARDEMIVQKLLPTPATGGATAEERALIMGGQPYRSAWAERTIRQRALRTGLACEIPGADGSVFDGQRAELTQALAYTDHILSVFTSDELLLLESAAEHGADSSARTVLGNSSAPNRWMHPAAMGLETSVVPGAAMADGPCPNGTG